MKNSIKIKEIGIDEIYTGEVKRFGYGGMISFLKRYIGKKVLVIIPKKKIKESIKIKNIEIDEIYTTEVKKHSNSARISSLKRYIGKKVIIIIPKK